MADARALDSGLIGHWKLQGDARDYSGNGNHGINHGADFSAAGPQGKANTAAKFGGRFDYIQVPDSPSLQLGTGNFSISAWVHTEKMLDDVLGDIIAKYDPVTRKGFTLNVKIHAGVTSSQANYRHVHFGIDGGKADAVWTDCGRPGKAVFIWALAVHEGNLYAGTCEPGEGDAGHVYRYLGNAQWEDCGSPDRCNSVSSLAVYEGKLYAGVTRYHLPHSSLEPSSNQFPGGKVYRYEGNRQWTDCGKLGDSVALHGMAVYQGQLYVTSMYAPAGVFRYEGGQKWADCGTPEGRRVEALAVFNGSLYGTGYDAGEVYRYEGDKKWSIVGRPAGTDQTYGFAIYAGQLYLSTWPNATVFRYDGDDRWTSCGRLGNENEVMGMVIYNGKLYAGTLPLAEVYRYDGGLDWTCVGRLDFTPDVRYRRAWSMAVYQGKLFCGTLPSGHVHALEVGRSATYDHELAPGWRHLVAVRDSDRLRLYLDGKQVAVSSAFVSTDYDLSNDRALTIGFGDHDYFNGILSDLRLYNRALSNAEVTALFNL